MSRLDLTQPDDLGAFIGKTLASFVSGNNQPDMSGDDRNRIRHPHIRERYDRSCVKLAAEILAARPDASQVGIAAGDEPKDPAMIAATQQPAGEGLPGGVYYSHEHQNFYDQSGVGMGLDFWKRWSERRLDVPIVFSPETERCGEVGHQPGCDCAVAEEDVARSKPPIAALSATQQPGRPEK